MEKVLSVSEYAGKYGKDPGNIRRHLSEGRMAGYKIGRQWVIPEGTVYPDDERVVTGEYRNWRKKALWNSNAFLKKKIELMTQDLVSIYGDSLISVILYGSYARGTQNVDSDVDIALIINKKVSKHITDEMISCVAAYELDTDKVLSVIEIESENFNQWKSALPFYRSIEKEGIVLWKKK